MGHAFKGVTVCALVAFAFAAGLIIGVIGKPQPVPPDPSRYLDLADPRNVAEVISLCAEWPEKFTTKADDMEACRLASRHFLAQTFRQQ